MSLATSASRYVPDFRVAIQGADIPAALRLAVTSVRYETGLEGADRVELSIVDPGLRWLDHPLLAPEGELTLAIGYRPDALAEVFLGEITGVECAFSSSGATLTLTAHDFMQRLAQGTHNRSFPALPDTVIAAIIADENLLQPDLDLAGIAISALSIRPRQQYGQTNYDFLRQLAAENGFEMTVEGRRFFFKPYLPEVPPPEVTLRWGQSLLDFTPRVSTVGQVVAVSVKIFIEEIKLQLNLEVSWDGERLGVRLVPSLFEEVAGGVSASLSIPDLPSDDPAEALRTALGELRRRLNNLITGSGNTIGDPRILAGRVIALDGLGERFSSQSYRVTSASHTLDSGGYRTSFQVRKEVI